MLDLVENFTLFSEHKAGLVKILGQNHQFLGVNNAIASMRAIRERSAGLRPAAASPPRDALEDLERIDPPGVLRLTEPRSTANPNGIGVFWQTQDSGKSFSMVFFAQKVLRKLAGNWTFVGRLGVGPRQDADGQGIGFFELAVFDAYKRFWAACFACKHIRRHGIFARVLSQSQALTNASEPRRHKAHKAGRIRKLP